MPYLNKVLLIGHLGRDVELRHISNGNAVANFSIATSEKWKDKSSGEWQTRTEWHNIQAWGSLGERCAEYLHKGSTVWVEGKIQSREYEAKDGQMKKVYEIIASQVLFLDGKNSGKKEKSGINVPDETPLTPVGQQRLNGDSIPF
jgi:single-strand DNA-binding protein